MKAPQRRKGVALAPAERAVQAEGKDYLTDKVPQTEGRPVGSRNWKGNGARKQGYGG